MQAKQNNKRAKRARHWPALCLLAGGLAAAPLAGRAADAADAATAAARQTYRIPGGSLAGALNRFAEISGHELVYDSGLTSGLKSPGLNGAFTADEALRHLLSGTGLNARATGARSYTLQKGAPRAEPAAAVPAPHSAQSAAEVSALPKITVTGRYDPDKDPTSYSARNATTATKTETPLMQTPMSVKVVPQQVLLDQQVVRIDQALKNVSSVVSGSGGDRQFFIRGFDTYNYYRDGYPFKNVLFHTEDLTNVERVEVLKGPGSILYGRADPGGIINFVIKQPLSTPYYSLRQQFGSFDWYRTNADLTGPVAGRDDLAYRFNFGYQSNNSYQDFASEERTFVAPALRWNITEQTTSTLKLEYSDIKKRGEGNLPLVGKRPANVPRRQNLGDPWNFQQDEYVMLSLQTEHRFNDDWKILHRFNASFYDYTTSSMGVNGDWDSLTPSGDFGRFFFAQNIDGKDYADNYYNSLELTGTFETGFVKHTLLIGGDYLRSNIRSTMAGFGSNPSHYDVTNIYRPVHKARAPVITAADITENVWSIPWFGLYIQDQAELPYNVHAMFGLRYDEASTHEFYRFGGVRTPDTEDSNDQVSPRGGLLWQPIPELSLYGSYTENFGASNTFGNFLSRPIGPQTAQQWEIGAKTALWDERFTATIAYYELTKQNIKMDLAPGVTRAVGEAETHGIELDVSGEILPGLSVIGAYSYMPFAKTLEDSPTAGTVGKRLHNAPEHSGSLWATYEIQEGDLQGFKFGAGVQAVGQRQIGYKEAAQAPGYTTANLMASYRWRIGKTALTAQLNIDNLTDRRFIDHIYAYGPSHYGTPRMFLGSVKLEY